MRPLSEDLRKRIVDKRSEGYSAADISQMFGVCVRSVQRIYRLYLEQGTVKAAKMGKPEGSRLDTHRDSICGWIEEEPGLTLEQLTERCALQLKLPVHHTTVMRALSRWGYSYKKNALRQRAKSR